MSYWAIIGRACLDDLFRADLQDEFVRKPDGSPENDTSKLKSLWDFLCDTHSFRVKRWELGDLNRIISKIMPSSPDDPEKPMRDTAAIWQTALIKFPVPEISIETYALVGLCALDEKVAARYCAAASQSGVGGILEEKDKPPRFLPVGLEPALLAEFFADQSTCLYLKKIRKVVWISPDLTLRTCAMGTVVGVGEQHPFIYTDSPALDQAIAIGAIENLFRDLGF